MQKDLHIVPHKEKWAVKKEGVDKPTRVTNTQKEAIDIGRELAKKNQSELLIHGQNGKIREKNSYGNDPRQILG